MCKWYHFYLSLASKRPQLRLRCSTQLVTIAILLSKSARCSKFSLTSQATIVTMAFRHSQLLVLPGSPRYSRDLVIFLFF